MGESQVIVPCRGAGVLLEEDLKIGYGLGELLLGQVHLTLEHVPFGALGVDLQDLIDYRPGFVGLVQPQIDFGGFGPAHYILGIYGNGLLVSFNGFFRLVPSEVKIPQLKDRGNPLGINLHSFQKLLFRIFHTPLGNIEVSENHPGRYFLGGDLRCFDELSLG